jgi:5S rRNA maturation endonuclease (ribonuclease M5)
LSTHLKEKEERIERLLESLAEESAKGTLIVVEGWKDVKALRALGIEGKIITVKTGGKSLLGVLSDLEALKVGEVILLLDFDRRGKEATKHLKQSLESMGVTPNLAFWFELFGLVGKEVKDVEGLIRYMGTLKSKIGCSII